MENKLILNSILLGTLLISSCKKDKNKEPETPSNNQVNNTQTQVYNNFSRLKVGNYWVYQQFNIDANGNSTPNNKIDSCYIEKDTLINSKIYYKMVKPKAYSPNEKEISYQRDSLHYIVNSKGQKLFSSQDYSTILFSEFELIAPDTFYKFTTQMADKDMTITVPSGVFKTSNAKEIYWINPKFTAVPNPRNKNKRYAENIGVVAETLPFFASIPTSTERRLIRYHLN